MKTALITGASKGIGEAVARRLIEKGYTCISLARNYENCSITSDNFIPLICDLTDQKQLLAVIHKIKGEYEIDLLINNAGIGYFGLHEELNPAKIHAMVATNLEAPLILVNQFLRMLKEDHGQIINIESITAAQCNPHGCAYGATKAGMLSFSKSLFQEIRKYGVKVTSILPDMTKTNFYDHSNFSEGDSYDSYLLPDEVADAVCYAITSRDGLVLSEITLQPQKHQIRRK
ncbi:3-oxoacyl-[acyl-carrier protein] reductase [Lachnospiraceae bacterium KM106-2]|nr:3-oxoacyl-[acyl-carrier protein] reductase [Lachnospiraceae bacterium KM106-2]